MEYCSVAFHSSLTTEQRSKLEQIQKTCLRVILGEMYVSYEAALEMCGLETLDTRREVRCLTFARRCLKYPRTSRIFPYKSAHEQNVRKRETFVVNPARTSSYQKSAIPYCQRILNKNL